jgi:hypothetical protein
MLIAALPLLAASVGGVASLPADKPRRGNLLTDAFRLLGEHRRAYLVTNLAYYGVILVGMAIVAGNPELQKAMQDALGQAVGEGGVLSGVADAYETNPVLAIGLTFGVNLLLGSLVSINIPSAIIPFSGWLVGLYRALLWGFIFYPMPGTVINAESIGTGALLVGLLLLEGQGYVLAMFAAYLHGRAFLFPRRSGVENAAQGYVLGLKQSALIYLLVIITLVIAALYEVAIYQVLI